MSTSDDELLDAAERAASRLGLAGVTADSIAQEAGVNRVTLYRRALTPAHLLAAAVRRASGELREALWPALTGAGSGQDRLRAALVGICEVAEAHLGVLAGVFDGPSAMFHLPVEDDGRVTRFEFVEPLERLLRDGMADGSLRQVDPSETAEVLFNQVGWTYVHLRRSHGWSPQRATGSVVDLAVASVRAAS